LYYIGPYLSKSAVDVIDPSDACDTEDDENAFIKSYNILCCYFRAYTMW